MRLEGQTMLSLSSASDRFDAALTPRRGQAQSPGVVPFTNLDEVTSYLLAHCNQTRSVYVIDNPFLSRVQKSNRFQACDRFVEVLCNLHKLETLSLQRSFINDDCVVKLCQRWQQGRLPCLCQINLNQNLVSDEGFSALAGCLANLPSSIDNIKVWAQNQLKPSTLVTHQLLVEAIESNPRIIHFEINWRSDDLSTSVTALIRKRQTHYASSVKNLQSSLVEIRSQTPHLKVFRLADNDALYHIWAKDMGDPDQAGLLMEPALPNSIQVMATLTLLATNHHLVTLELPDFFLNAVVGDGSFRSIRHLNLERNRFNIDDLIKIVSLLDVHFAFEEANPCALMPFESLRLAGQEELEGTDVIEKNRDLIVSKFIFNHSLNDLTIDRNEKKHRSRIAIGSLNQQFASPISVTLRRESASVSKPSWSGEEPSPNESPVLSPRARFLFSPMSPLENDIPSVDTIDDVMVMVARESPTIEDFTLSNSRFLCCLNESNEIRFSRALVNLLAYNFQLHTIALTNCGIRDPFLSSLISAKANGDFPHLVALDFYRNSLTDNIIVSLLGSPFFDLKLIRLRHRSSICSARMGITVLKLLKRYHRKRLQVFEFDFDNADLERQAEQMLIDTANS